MFKSSIGSIAGPSNFSTLPGLRARGGFRGRAALGARQRAAIVALHLLQLRVAEQVASRVEKFDRRGTEPNELLNIRIRAEILSEFRKFCQNSSEIQKFEDLSTFSKLFIEILRNSH